MAYLTHVSGEAFAEYFRGGQTWGDGGMQAAGFLAGRKFI